MISFRSSSAFDSFNVYQSDNLSLIFDPNPKCGVTHASFDSDSPYVSSWHLRIEFWTS
jgi:hypothetical protein